MKYCEVKKIVGESRSGRWWQDADKKKSGPKWKTLCHNGVYFPEAYERLPSKIRVLYKGKPVALDHSNTNNSFNMSAEEAMIYFAQMVDRDERLKKDKKRHRYSDDPVFRANFWKDWKKILGSGSVIKDMKDVNFKPVADYLFKNSESKKATKKAMTKEEKEAEKAQKEAIRELYGFANIDGVKIPMDYVVEIPGLYQGHGKHPLRGRIKKRLKPSDITINVSKKCVPKCVTHGKPCKWGEVVENRNVTWIAAWKHPITGEMTYKWLKRTESHFVCAGDMEKFDKASKLDKNIESIRKKYRRDLKSSKNDIRQLATAVYLLDVLAIRPGTEKDEAKEAGTLGLTTLKCTNVKFSSDNYITIDFTGKSSIQFNKKFKVDSTVYSNLKGLCGGKGKSSALFPNVNATSLNAYLKTLLPGLTAKVFRTWKASSILQNELDKNIPESNIPVYEKKLIYDKVNIAVAKALNHKRMTSNDDRIKKIKTKIKEFKGKLKIAKTASQKASATRSIATWTSKLEEAEGNIALSTSKANYLDPRISVVWAKKANCPIEKIYNKTYLQKFVWAMDAGLSWQF
uniref:DNA topoisomerase 1 n=1 Tax=viral metagenome TaxID=1070528 RepID=A0A6C0EK95_9ZZZZ